MGNSSFRSAAAGRWHILLAHTSAASLSLGYPLPAIGGRGHEQQLKCALLPPDVAPRPSFVRLPKFP